MDAEKDDEIELRLKKIAERLEEVEQRSQEINAENNLRNARLEEAFAINQNGVINPTPNENMDSLKPDIPEPIYFQRVILLYVLTSGNATTGNEYF